MRRSVRVGTALGSAVLAVGVLAACSGGGSDVGGPNDAGVPAASLPTPAASSSSPATRDAAGSPGSGGGRAADVPAIGTAVVRTADLTVEVRRPRDVAAKADVAGDFATRVGGEVAADDRTGGRYATATLRLRVPPDELQSTLRALARLGNATSRHVSSRDVTQQVADVRSRVASAQDAIARLRVLYARASRVTDVISIENQLAQREADLESLQAQQRILATQTSLSTITLSLRVADAPAAKPKHDDRDGFLGGLSKGWDAFVDAARAVALGVGAALPFVGVLLVLALGLRLALRRRPRRSAPEPTHH